MSTAAVIGARGFLGAAVAAGLERAGWQVLHIGRDTPLPAEPVDVVVDCAGDARRFFCNRDPAHSFAANVQSVMTRLTRLRFGRYVYCSTVDVYGTGRGDRATSGEASGIALDGLDTYALHKYVAEQLVRHHAPGALVLRLGTLVGPGLKKNPVFDAVSGNPLRVTADSALSLMHVDLAADIVAALLQRGAAGIWNVTGRRSIAIPDLLARVGEHGLGPAQWLWHEETIRTLYDIDTGKLEQMIDLPDSDAILRRHLALVTAPVQAV